MHPDWTPPEIKSALMTTAVTSLRKTVETRDRGVLYEHPVGDARAHELERAAEARDGKAVVDLAGQVKQVCAACHDEFR